MEIVKTSMPPVSPEWTTQDRLNVVAWINDCIMEHIRQRQSLPDTNTLVGLFESIHMLTHYAVSPLASNRVLICRYVEDLEL